MGKWSVAGRVSTGDVDVQVLGVLVAPEVRDDARCAVLALHVPRHRLHDVEELPQELLVRAGQIGERRDVVFGTTTTCTGQCGRVWW